MGVINAAGLTELEFLAQYNGNKYEKPSVTADMVIFTINDEEQDNYRKLPNKQLQLLMIKRGDHPCINQWALPGGFAHVNEDLDVTAYRELKEETNLDNIYMEQLYTWGEAERDPRTRVISTSFLALVNSESLKKLRAGDDASDAQWFTVKTRLIQEVRHIHQNGTITKENLVELMLINNDIELSARILITKIIEDNVTKIEYQMIESKDIAFDHGKIIYYSLERLRNKVEYSHIAFNLMPKFFTLTELQQVYEIILDKELLTANFRRKTAGMVTAINDKKKDKGHRPSQLFKLNTTWIEDNFFIN